MAKLALIRIAGTLAAMAMFAAAATEASAQEQLVLNNQLQLGDVISGLTEVSGNAKVFHAGTALDAEGNVISAGGRVLCVAALGDSVSDAQHNAYAGVARIHWANEFHRSDSGWRAIEREQA